MTQLSDNGFQAPRFLALWDVSIGATRPEIRIGAQLIWHCPVNDDWVWADGYIANRAELLHHPDLRGVEEDQEVLHRLYHQRGVDAAKSIAGTFTWVLWDSQQQELVIARDRIGNHNYYLATLNGVVWIANWLEALLGLPGFSRHPNPRSLVAQITSNAPLVGETFYDSIQELAPGSWMRIQRQARQAGRYWQVEPQPLLKLPSDDEYAQALRELLFRLAAEHAPAGQAHITLSSGLDSTSIAAAIRHAAPQTSLRALCWSSPELPEADESHYSAEVCRFLDIPSTELRADLLWPLSRPEGVHTSALMPFYGYYSELLDETFQLARSLGSKVVFSGMSGDHLFGGNVFAYPDLLLTGHWLELARQIRYHLPRSSMGLSQSQIVRRMVLSPLRQAYLPGLRRSVVPAANWLRPPYDQLYQEHFTRPPEVRWMLPGRLARYRLLSHPKLPRFADAMNRQAESQGIEFRHPLLDHRLLEFAASLPTDQTFRASQRKIIVRNAMRGLLPSSVLEMWDKILPTAILHRGLREREQAKVLHLMTDMRAADLGFVDPSKLHQAYQDYLSAKTDNTLFWHTLTLEDWLRRWF